MRNKMKIYIIVSLSFLLQSCGFASKTVIVPGMETKYDSMWEAAIQTGRNMGYRLVAEDKGRGELNFENPILDDVYYIRVSFGKLADAGGKTGFLVSCRTKNDLINPFVSGDCKKIETAIKQAAGIP